MNKSSCPLCAHLPEKDRPGEIAVKKNLRMLVESRGSRPPFQGDGPQVHTSCFNNGQGVRVLIQQTVTEQTAAQTTTKKTTPTPEPSAWSQVAAIRTAT